MSLRGQPISRDEHLPFAGRSLDDIRRGLNQQWRRNIKKAGKGGVKVVRGGHDDLPAFYALYAETAERDRFKAQRTSRTRAPRPYPTARAQLDAAPADPYTGPVFRAALHLWVAASNEE